MMKNTQKVALITGITGQDGSYLAEFLLEKGYIVHGIKRRASSFNTGRIDHLYQDPHVNHPDLILHYGDLTDTSNLVRIIQECQPDEIYNLGAQSHVAVSFLPISSFPSFMRNSHGVLSRSISRVFLSETNLTSCPLASPFVLSTLNSILEGRP